MTKLEVELVPSTCWWSNVRSNVSPKDWQKCKTLVRKRSGDKCEICGDNGRNQGRKWPVECHETWDYDDDRQIQTLIGLIALCPLCHQSKHAGFAAANGTLDVVVQHLMNVNGWSGPQTQMYLEWAFELQALRSTWEWSLDISLLSLLDIVPLVTDRPAPPQPMHERFEPNAIPNTHYRAKALQGLQYRTVARGN